MRNPVMDNKSEATQIYKEKGGGWKSAYVISNLLNFSYI